MIIFLTQWRVTESKCGPKETNTGIVLLKIKQNIQYSFVQHYIRNSNQCKTRKK